MESGRMRQSRSEMGAAAMPTPHPGIRSIPQWPRRVARSRPNRLANFVPKSSRKAGTASAKRTRWQHPLQLTIYNRSVRRDSFFFCSYFHMIFQYGVRHGCIVNDKRRSKSEESGKVMQYHPSSRRLAAVRPSPMPRQMSRARLRRRPGHGAHAAVFARESLHPMLWRGGQNVTGTGVFTL